MTATNDTTTQAPQPTIEQEGSRSDIVTVNYDFERPLHIATSGIQTTNVRIERASTGWLKDHVHVRAQVSSISTTLHGRLHARSDITNGEYSLTLKVDSSLWDLGWTNAEVTIVLPINGDESDNAQLEHPGIRVAVPNGSIGATMLGNTSIRSLELATDHGPAHLSDIAVGSLKLTAHNGNITVHDVCAQDAVEISGKTAWMDIDDVKATSLRATSVDAIISLKDVDAKEVWATTSNARVGLGNIKAGTLSVSTTNSEVFANNVFVDACEVNVEKGDIEGDWSPRKKLYLSTTEAKIAAKVLVDPNESLEMTLRSTKGPVVVDLPATFSGGFSLKTTGFYKTFIHTDPKVKTSPVLHVSQPDSKMGVLSSGDMRHSLKVITEEAPVTVNFGSL